MNPSTNSPAISNNTSAAAANDWFSALASNHVASPHGPLSQGNTGAAAVLRTEDTNLLTKLMNDVGNGTKSLLSKLTGAAYSPSNPPDFIAVRTGPDVISEYAGGYGAVGWSSDKASVDFFATGTPPNAGKGFAITFAAGASSADRQTNLNMAMQCLNSHLSDSQNAAGVWNQPPNQGPTTCPGTPFVERWAVRRRRMSNARASRSR